MAYLTDMFGHLIAAGEAMTPVYIDGHWREIDSVEELLRVRREIDSRAASGQRLFCRSAAGGARA